MITQYTRAIIETATNEILHCTSQDYPFVENWDPVEYDPATMQAVDFEIESNLPPADFTVGQDQQLIRAREIIDNLELKNGAPVLKAGAAPTVADKIFKISAEKPINEIAIRAELAAFIGAELVKGGSSEAELIAAMKKADAKTGASLADLKTLQLIRLKNSLPAAVAAPK